MVTDSTQESERDELNRPKLTIILALYTKS